MYSTIPVYRIIRSIAVFRRYFNTTVVNDIGGAKYLNYTPVYITQYLERDCGVSEHGIRTCIGLRCNAQQMNRHTRRTADENDGYGCALFILHYYYIIFLLDYKLINAATAIYRVPVRFAVQATAGFISCAYNIISFARPYV